MIKKSITIKDLALTIEDLSVMVKGGFDEVNRQFALPEKFVTKDYFRDKLNERFDYFAKWFFVIAGESPLR